MAWLVASLMPGAVKITQTYDVDTDSEEVQATVKFTAKVVLPPQRDAVAKELAALLTQQLRDQVEAWLAEGEHYE